MAGSSSAGHAIIYRESALTFEEWDIAELNEQVQLICQVCKTRLFELLKEEIRLRSAPTCLSTLTTLMDRMSGA